MILLYLDTDYYVCAIKQYVGIGHNYLQNKDLVPKSTLFISLNEMKGYNNTAEGSSLSPKEEFSKSPW